MSDSKAASLSRRAWLGGALALACSRATEAPAEVSAETAGAAHGGDALGGTERSNQRPAKAEAAGSGFAVVELFTSQGCSSCPPADRVLRTLTDDADQSVLTLSFHVDYWNYLGWADPYSSARYSARQRSYASRLSGGRVFTPQAIVNGRHSALGSAQGEIEDLIRMEKKVASLARLDLEYVAGTLSYRAGALRGGISGGLKLALLLLQNSVHNPVPRGENSGEDLSHVHVVRALLEREMALEDDGTATGNWKLDLAGLTPKPAASPSNLSAAALISDPSGAIVGATLIGLS
ncbi:MAG: DUF1223 domain-containing protein [Polyangiaceae bacterium]|nr:DUF1223 domain-containing protein [Polyangiaceae bacterium]